MSDTLQEIPGVLDLSGADTSTFEAIPAGRYNATVWEASWAATKGGPNAKMPEGTPMLKVQFRLDDEYADVEYVDSDGNATKIGKNRRVFSQYTIPPANYDADKAAKLKGMLVNMLLGLGYDQKEVNSGKFKMDLEDMKGNECVVVLSRKEFPPESGTYTNNVQGVKPAGSGASGAGNASGGLL